MTKKTHTHAPVGSNHQITLCPNPSCNCGCPQIHTSADGAEVITTDDHGGTVRYTKDEFRMFVEEAKAGKLDDLVR